MEQYTNTSIKNFLSELVSAWHLTAPAYPFLRARFRKILTENPEKTLDALFLTLYLKHPALSTFSGLRSFLLAHLPCLYPGILSYARHLKKFQHSVLEGPLSIVLREIRFLCREVILVTLNNPAIPYPARKQLHQALQKIKPFNPYPAAEIPFCPEEVIANLPYYLEKADLLAELPQLLPVYFTADELQHFSGSLHIHKFTPEDEVRLEKILNLLRKREILRELLRLVATFPMILKAKQALAVHFSLGEVIPWAKHPFIRRLLAVSHQEIQVLLAKK